MLRRPILVTAAKRALITIPRVEYDALLACREQLQRLSNGQSVAVNPGQGGRSPIEFDPELAAFIRDRLGRDRLTAIAAACRSRFGPSRAPSKSAIHRYWLRLNGRKSTPKRRLQPPA